MEHTNHVLNVPHCWVLFTAKYLVPELANTMPLACKIGTPS